MNLSFLGAAGTVTGSRFLVSGGGCRVLVDCGLFQGPKALRLRNREDLPFDPASLDAVVLTHAHLDHSGYLPVLVREGFRGPIYCTPPTVDLVEILLADAAHLQEEDARYANRKGFSRHHPAEPLFTAADARAVLPLLRPVNPGHELDAGTFLLRFGLAGHILGAAWARVTAEDVSVLFSGDLGRGQDLLIPPPDPPPPADHVVIETTYGGRNHPSVDLVEVLGAVVRETASRGGVVMAPAFAVGRAQLLLYALALGRERELLPDVPVFLNSPMAIDVTSLYAEHPSYHRLTAAAASRIFGAATYVHDAEDSKALNRRRGPMVLVAGAGMLTGGRILHHLRAFGDDPKSTLLLTGHQARGTRGADLLAGATALKIHGAMVPVRAERRVLPGLSAHAGQDELLAWLEALPSAPRTVHLVHGETDQAEAFRQAVVARTGWSARVAVDGATVSLG